MFWRGALVVVAAFKDEDANARLVACDCLVRIGPKVKSVVAGLVELLKENESRLEAVETLLRIGPGAKLAIPALMEREQALKNSNPQAPPLELEVRESHADKPFSIEVPGQPEKSLN